MNIGNNCLRKRTTFLERSGIKRKPTKAHYVGISMLKSYPSQIFIDFMTNLIVNEIGEPNCRPGQ